MHRILFLIVAFVSISTSYAQSIQTGFVAVRPVNGFGGGLMVFGRFAFNDGASTFQSTVWADAVVTRGALVVTSDPASGQNTGIAIVNPTDFPADVNLVLRNHLGVIVGVRPIILRPREQVSRFVSELFGIANVTGLLAVESTVPISMVGLQFKGPAFSVVPTNGPQGETALLLPQFATGGGWSSELFIANLTGLVQTVEVDFFNPNGIITSTVRNVIVLPAAVAVINR